MNKKTHLFLLIFYVPILFTLGSCKNSRQDGIANKREIDYEKKTIKDLIKEKQIKFRDGFIDSNDSLGDVIERLNESEQIYFPVIKNNVLIGRVSKRILRGKIKDLYWLTILSDNC